MTNLPDEDDSAYPKCPHCGHIHICKHVALAVDLTFREILGGSLENDFYETRDHSSVEESGESVNYGEKFDKYIHQIRISGNFTEVNYSDNPGPGLSSSYATFYRK